MEHKTSEQVRQLWKEFFESAQLHHARAAPVSLIPPAQDKTVIFNTSGMQQFIPYLVGKAHPLGNRLYNIQGCVRTNDIDDIGDERHLSYFEMMGNRSLGDYFKKESLTRSISFLTDKCGIPLEKLGATIFVGEGNVPKDLEAKQTLLELGIPESRIRELNEDNFRSPGPVGPCGPCCEIFYDRGDAYGPADRNIGENDRYTEIWNNVFMQYYRDESGTLTQLPQQNVDTGMGLERLCMVLQDKETIFETDLFTTIIQHIENLTEKEYPAFSKKESDFDDVDKKRTRSFRIITDHLRASTFLLSGGVIPSNEGRGYVLRRLIRRMFVHLSKLSNDDGPRLKPDQIKASITSLIDAVIEKYHQTYPELSSRRAVIIESMCGELLQFQETVKKGEKRLTELFGKGQNISGKDAFLLYDTYGFPIELTKELATDRGLSVDMDGFTTEMTKAQERSRQGGQKMFTKGTDRSTYIQGIAPTQFVGRENLELENPVLLKDFSVDQKRVLIFDKTPFYAEGGGQKADTGTIQLDDGSTVRVLDVQKYEGVFLHFVE